MNTQAKFTNSRYYHVYNRTNNGDLLFRSDENKRFFLEKLKTYCGDYVKFHSYSLLPNHFHLLISVRSASDIYVKIKKLDPNVITTAQREYLLNTELINKLITQQFLRFFTSYVKSYNKYYNRTGNLLNRPFKRSEINSVSKLLYLHHYLVHNAFNHKIVENFEDHKWNSYAEIISGRSEIIEIKEVLELFGSKSEFSSFILSKENFELFKKNKVEGH